MNRNLILIAVAGIGVGLLLPALQGGPPTGSIVPMTTVPPLTIKLTPTPVPPVRITISGTCSPYRIWDNANKLYDWN